MVNKLLASGGHRERGHKCSRSKFRASARTIEMAQGKWIKNMTSDTKTVDAARHVLLARLAALRDGVRDVLRDSEDRFENVHQLRVAARRAAATLEIFEPCLKGKAHRKASKK